MTIRTRLAALVLMSGVAFPGVRLVAQTPSAPGAKKIYTKKTAFKIVSLPVIDDGQYLF